jgi:hypothetical protein
MAGFVLFCEPDMSGYYGTSGIRNISLEQDTHEKFSVQIVPDLFTLFACLISHCTNDLP